MTALLTPVTIMAIRRPNGSGVRSRPMIFPARRCAPAGLNNGPWYANAIGQRRHGGSGVPLFTVRLNSRAFGPFQTSWKDCVNRLPSAYRVWLSPVAIQQNPSGRRP